MTGSSERPRALATRRLLLRPPRMEHAAAMFAGYASDPAVTRFLRWEPHTSPDATRAYLGDLLRRVESGEEHSWLALAKPSGHVVGSIALHPGEQEAELGYAFARSTWGRGLATEAARAAIAHAFTVLDLRRVWAACDVDNLASKRVLEKLGMKLLRRVPRHSVHPGMGRTPRDCFLYALDRTLPSR